MLLAIGHTWPLAVDPTHLSSVDGGDAQRDAWIVSWIAHQLPQDPLHLFDANIFHPTGYALAYSDPLLAPTLIGTPLRWLGASPIATYNLPVLIGLALTGLSMYVLVMRFTGDHLAGVLAGSLLAFNAHTLTGLGQLQTLHAQWLPLALWALDRLLIGGRRRDGLWLALFVSLAVLDVQLHGGPDRGDARGSGTHKTGPLVATSRAGGRGHPGHERRTRGRATYGGALAVQHGRSGACLFRIP